uniref:Uncharacterized protein n=1 Tax=Vombatus ursinus TaxID=29139 RepID=A0A4X2K838_VOMUR
HNSIYLPGLLWGSNEIISVKLSLLCNSWRRAISNQRYSGPTKPALKKPKLSQRCISAPEAPSLEQDPLEELPDDVSPVTNQSDPQSHEPMSYGDGKQKGHCVDVLWIDPLTKVSYPEYNIFYWILICFISLHSFKFFL